MLNPILTTNSKFPDIISRGLRKMAKNFEKIKIATNFEKIKVRSNYFFLSITSESDCQLYHYYLISKNEYLKISNSVGRALLVMYILLSHEMLRE